MNHGFLVTGVIGYESVPVRYKFVFITQMLYLIRGVLKRLGLAVALSTHVNLREDMHHIFVVSRSPK